ncbi:MAG TPA: hypothetical protein PLC86_16995 [Candidatus Accumulibacter phosphatis]|nr:hypothetical protein [Candidatus Accumulibacter phosphatis]
MKAANPSLLSRISIAFGTFFAVLADGDLAARIQALRSGEQRREPAAPALLTHPRGTETRPRMAEDPEIARRELRRNLLLARCELDRHELQAEFTALREHWSARVDQVRTFTPWAALAAPLAGILLARALRPGKLAGAASLIGVAWQLRKTWPTLAALLRTFRNTRPRPPRAPV